MQNNIKRLPDAYYKKTDGNNFKLLDLNERACREMTADSDIVLESADLFKASGKTLDYLGQSVGQFRGKLDDEQYRQLILNRIYRNTCQGGYSKVVELLAPLLKTSTDNINLQDTNISGAVELVGFTLSDLLKSGYAMAETVAIIEALLPIGVRLSDANFEGTFEFGDEYEGLIKDLEGKTYELLGELTYAALEGPFEYDPVHGFGDENEDDDKQITGGYLGLVTGDSSGVRVPL